MNYNVDNMTVINQSYLETVDATICSEINNWYRCLKKVVPKGFQATVEIKDSETGNIDYSTGILQKPPGRSNVAGGSFAQVKLDTLHKFPSLAMTGAGTIDELIHMIRTIRPDYDVSTFASLENVCQLTRAQHEELRREIGITAYLGGIRVPFIRIVSTYGKGRSEEFKEVCITFSALTGEGDLNMCCYVLSVLQRALAASVSNAFYIFGLSF